MTTDKLSVARLVMICQKMGVRDVVISPGSRNAPLIIAFTQAGGFNIYNIPDERVAAFYAMGLSIHSQLPTAICCTSGTAALNYAPAICEAYYQYVPLLVLTADRPVEKIDQGIGQSMRQNNVYHNYIKQSYQLIQEASSEEDIQSNDEMVIDAIQTSMMSNKGPVHINIPLAEPLYNQIEYKSAINFDVGNQNLHPFELKTELKNIWTSSRRKVVIVGQQIPNETINRQLDHLVRRNNIVLLTETTSNVYSDKSIACIDRVIDALEVTHKEYEPDLLIYLGGQIISKKIKNLFSSYAIKNQWHINPNKSKDTFDGLTAHVKTQTEKFLDTIADTESENEMAFQAHWQNKNVSCRGLHDQFLSQASYSDLRVFDYLLKSIPEDAVLHASNSTVIRYVQLFDQRKDLTYHSNRGVSGIDGSTSTAMGFAMHSDTLNVLITGDMSFFYDSNAFWHHHIPDNFKIILINNGGGNIFRIIPGPDTTAALEQHFEAHHDTQALHLSRMYNLDYFRSESEEELTEQFPKFLESNKGKAQIIEILTPRLENDKVLKDYFRFLTKVN